MVENSGLISKLSYPDIAGWRRNRYRMYFEETTVYVKEKGPKPQTVPDWICEVTSPSNFANDLNLKYSLYAQAGILDYWVIDLGSKKPRKFVYCYRKITGSKFQIHYEVSKSFDFDTSFCAEPFEAVPIIIASYLNADL